MTVSAKDVVHVAELANLELTAEESASLLRDLNSILDYVAQLNELDTAQIVPMVQAVEQLEAPAETRETLRSDESRPSLTRERVLQSAPDTDGIYFKVPKVIER